MSKKKSGRGNGRHEQPDRAAVRSVLKSMSGKGARVNLIDVLGEVYEVSAAPGEELAWLAAYDLDPQVSEIATTALFAALSEEDVPGYDIEDLAPVLSPVFREALGSPNVPDDRKLRLGSLIQMCGHNPLEEESFARLVNSEEVQDRLLTDVAKSITSSPASFGEFLESIGILPKDGQAPPEEAVEFALLVVREVSVHEPVAAAWMLGTIAAVTAECEMSDHARAAIEDLAALGSAEALWCLEELGRWPGVPALSLQARTAAAELARTGLAPRLGLAREFSHGLVTNVDGAGSRSVNLFFRTPEGSMDMATILVNETRGMIDAWCAYDDGAGIEEEIREITNTDEATLSPCPLEFGRVVLADVWALHQGERKPFPGSFFLHRAYFGEAPIVAQRHTPDLRPYKLDAMEVSPALFDGDVNELLDSPAYAGTRFVSDAAYKFVAEHAPSRAPNLSKQKLALFARTTAVAEKERVMAHMAANLETEVLAGRAHWEENRLAARTLLGLTHEVLPFHEVPYIQELCALSTEAILNNLRQGFTSQAEVDQAMLEMDASPWDDEDYEEDYDDKDVPF